MTEVFVVQGEHPHDPFYPLEVFASAAGATARAAELTKDFLEAVGEPDAPKPKVTIENWSALVEVHSSEGDADGFGRWYVSMDRHEVKP